MSDRPHIHFVTGRLAEHALRETLSDLAPRAGFDYSVQVLPITVAALMTPQWIARHIQVPEPATQVMLPGYCEADSTPVEQAAGRPVVFGPRDLRQLPEHFGGASQRGDYGGHDIEIIAEINHAPRMTLDEILHAARQLARDGADVIDVGCDPGGAWSGAGECVRALRQEGLRVSIDSFDPREIEPAARAGAELVLSVNASNRHAAADWGCEVVAIPDDLSRLDSLEETLEALSAAGAPFRIDPVLEPIGFGFAASLARYMEARRRWPQERMMMGIGNLTELTDVDSAGVNVLLLAICQELAIGSVLTTQVINWARTSVRECDLARRLAHYAVTKRTVPKHLEPRLVTLRDARLYEHGPERLEALAASLKDRNYRLFAEGGALHVIRAGLHLQDEDPFVLFDKLLAHDAERIDASHAFYLGYELAKAATAITLSKQYRQDEALDWGYLTAPEQSHRERKRAKQGPGEAK